MHFSPHNIHDLDLELSHTFGEVEPRGLIIINARICLTRNLNTAAFPPKLTKRESNKLSYAIISQLHSIPDFHNNLLFDVAEWDTVEKRSFVEIGFLTNREEESISSQNPHEIRKILVSSDMTRSVIINDEDHIKVQITKKTEDICTLWKYVYKLDTDIAKRLPYAYTDQWGYLTKSIRLVGTGMKASFLLHLPGLVMVNDIGKCIYACEQLGLNLTEMFANPVGSSNHYRLENKYTLGVNEQDIIDLIQRTADNLAVQEELARKRILSHKIQNKMLQNQIGRALGSLQHSYSLTINEAQSFVSLLKLGYDLDLIQSQSPILWDNIMRLTLPNQLIANNKELLNSQDSMDVIRARKFRELTEPMTISFK